MSLSHLQNGSDIRGIAISTEDYSANLTPDVVKQISSGVIAWLRQTPEYDQKYLNGTLCIGIGRDSRLSGKALSDAFIEQATYQGINIIDFGLATTPSIFMSTQYEAFLTDASIMITASHLPFYFNGIKIFNRTSGANHEDISFILNHTVSQNNGYVGTIKTADILTPYSLDLINKIKQGSQSTDDKPLQNMHIIVDAGNGAGGFFALHVLEPLGATTTGSQFLDPDGTFPNHIPNPDNKQAMESIRQAVLTHQADLGIIFDTDVDRAAVVTKNGAILNRNNLIAVLSKIVLTEYPNTSIVTNSTTSDHLKVFIESLGGRQIRYISGYRNVINKAIEVNEKGIDCQLAIETSGHAAFKENYFLDDGTYVAAKILMLLPQLTNGNTLDTIIKDLKQPVETQEVRFKLETENYKQLGQQILSDLEQYVIDGWTISPENQEGVRFTLSEPFGNGWFLLRMSLHEPLLVLQVENDLRGFMPIIFKTLHTFLNQYPDLNQENLLPFIQ